MEEAGNSLVTLHSTAEGMGSIPGDGGIKIPHAAQHGQKRNKHLFCFLILKKGFK